MTGDLFVWALGALIVAAIVVPLILATVVNVWRRPRERQKT